MGQKNYHYMQIDTAYSYVLLYDKVLSMQMVIWAEYEPFVSIVGFGVSGIEWLWMLILVCVHFWSVFDRSSVASASVRAQLLWSLGLQFAGAVALLIIVYIGKDFFSVVRPYELFSLGQGHVLLGEQSSFPSAHAAIFTYVTCVVYTGVRNEIMRAVGLFALAIVVFARVAAGYHFLSDIIIGCLLGVVVYEIVVRFTSAGRITSR
jgi:membrane-associated phospholipid phosphatase